MWFQRKGVYDLRRRNQRYSLQRSGDELAPVSHCKSHTKTTISVPRSLGTEKEMPFSSRIGASRLMMQQHGKARFRNARENNFAVKPGPRARARHLRSHSDFLPQGYCRSSEVHESRDCLSPVARCFSAGRSTPIASTLDDREADPRLSSGTYRMFCNRWYNVV